MKKPILLLATAIILISLGGCGNKGNYFGGEGQLQESFGILEDENNIYFTDYYTSTLKKFNKNFNTLSIACQTPGCTHENDIVSCKANLHNKRYCVFNGKLIKAVDESVQKDDGTFITKSYLYLCGDSEKRVFENVFPEELDSEETKNMETRIGVVETLGDDYLKVCSSACTYILDTDFNIKFTVLDMGPYSGGMYYVDNGIYYIDELYRLIKINTKNGEHSVVDFGSMKITEGVVTNGTLWFSNGEMAVCSYDFKTGEVKELTEKGVRMNLAGKYIEYMEWDVGDVYLLDTESGETRKWEGADINKDNLFFADGNYYVYKDDQLIQYSEDLLSTTNTYALAD